MKLIYKELEIELNLEGIIQVEEFLLEEGLNQHARICLKLLVNEEKAEELVTRASVQPVIIRENSRTQGRNIFQGKIETIRMKVEKGLSYLYIEAYSYSKEWDRVEKSQSFLNGADTYMDVARKAVAEYGAADIKDEITGGMRIPEILLQYEETDWVFLRRLASHFGTYLVPDASADCGRVYFGMPHISYGLNLKREDYELVKDMGHYSKVLMPAEILPQEASGWHIKSRQYQWIGEEVLLNEIKVIVTGVHISTENGELIYRYELSREEGIKREKESNPRIYGMSIPATVKERSGNRIRVHFDIDPAYESAPRNKYFTYAIESSSFYCMPEVGSRVHIYFPDKYEQSAIAVHAISSGTADGGGGKNPDNKRFSDPSGSAMDMTPEYLIFTADDTQSARLYMGSDGNIALNGIDISIKTQKGLMAGEGEEDTVQSIFINGGNSVSLTIGEAGSEEITLDTQANIIAAFVRQDADSRLPAEPSGEALANDMAEGDAEYRNANNAAVKDTMVARKQESKQKFLKGLKSIATVVAVTALIVCTGGAAAMGLPLILAAGAAGVAKTAFAIADMSEGIDGYSNVNALDTSQPYNFIRDGLMGGNQLLYDLTSMGVDIIFDLVTANALKKITMLKNVNQLMCKAGQTAEMVIKVGVNVIGGMVNDYLTTGTINPVNLLYNFTSGIIKGGLGSSLKHSFLKDLKIDSKILEKLTGIVVGTGIDTSIDWVLCMLWGREIDWIQVISQNLLANALAALFAEPVDAVTGGFLITATDFILSDIRESIRFERKYNSSNHSAGVMGKGWTFAYEGRLYRDEDKYHVQLDTGHYLVFKEEENGQYQNITKGCGWFHLSKDGENWKVYDRKRHKNYNYSDTGLLTSIEDQNSQKMEFNYDGDILKQITTTLGYQLNFFFWNGRLIQTEDHTGRCMQYRYEKGILVDVVHMDRGITHYDYDESGYLVTATDQTGVTYLENEYDRRGRVVKQTLANGDVYEAEYLEEERKNVVYNSVLNSRIIHSYSREGYPLSMEYQDGTAVRYSYDEMGYRVCSVNRLGEAVRWDYDETGRLKEETQAAGLITAYHYDETDDLVERSDNAGREKRYEYDSNHNLCQIKEKAGENNQWISVRYEYDRIGRRTSETDGEGNKTVYSYEEGCGKPAILSLPDGEEIQYEYDRGGRRLSAEDSCGRTEYGYNAKNYRTMMRDGEGNETRWMYDGMGRLLALYLPKAWKIRQGEYNHDDKYSYDDENNHDYGYNCDDNRSNSNDYHRDYSYSYSYDFLDRRIDTLRPDGSHVRIFRDGEGNILKKVHPNAYVKESDSGEGICYDYDSDGNQIRIHYPDGGCERMFYDAEGRRVKHVMPEAYNAETDDGSGYEYEYNATGKMVKIINPEDETEGLYTYDMCGNTLSYTDGAGRSIYYSYNLQGKLIQVLRPAEEKEGQVLYERISFKYYTSGTMVGTADLKEQIRHSGYWSREGKLVKEEGKDLTLQFTYDARNRLIKVEDNVGARIKYSYDVKGNRTCEEKQISDDVSQIIKYSYDKAGRLTERKEILNSGLEAAEGESKYAITLYSYDENGNRTKIVTPEGYHIYRKYDSCDRLICERSADKANGIDRTVSITYDRAGNITKLTRQGIDTDAWEISYDYDLKDRITHVEDCLGPVFIYDYNKNDKIEKEILPQAGEHASENNYSYSYDYRGNVIEKSDALETVHRRNSYLTDGKLERTETADGNSITYNYGINGKTAEVYTARSSKENQSAQEYNYDARGRITGLKDGRNNQTGYDVDGWGRISHIHSVDGGIEKYTYDYAGNITSTTDANGGVITYRYNSQGKMCEIIDQEGNSETFRYDREGRMTLHADRNGNQVRTSYNMDSKPVYKTGVDKDGKARVTNSFAYDSLGNLKKSLAGGFCYTYENRADGKLLRKSSSGKEIIACTYNNDGSLKTLTDESGKTVNYGYDFRGKLSEISDESGERIVSYSHYPDGKLKEILHGNGVKTCYEYDTDGNISRLVTLFATNEPLFDYRYAYDLNGNRTVKEGCRLKLTGEDICNTVIRYRYDSKNRLLEEDYAGESVQYRYDLCGNRLEKESLEDSESYNYNSKNQMTERTSHTGRTAYGYDSQGNLLEERGEERRNYYYNPFNQQLRIEERGECIQENLYDGESLRSGIETREGVSSFVYYRGELLTEKGEEGELSSRYILGYGVAASQVKGQEGYHSYHLDEQNSTAYITGLKEQVENAYVYDAFGELRIQTGNLPNCIMYTGQQYDKETELYYLRARYYKPVVGRFTQEDVYRGDGLNLYAYCANNPVIYYDPEGEAGKRQDYLGGTLRINSPGGRVVLDNMYSGGAIDISGMTNIELANKIAANGFEANNIKVTVDLKEEISFKSADDGNWYSLSDSNMSHKNTDGYKDAVTEWNDELYQYGIKSEQGREYMKDPDNYYIETEHANKRDGARLKETYRDPAEPEAEDVKEETKNEKCP